MTSPPPESDRFWSILDTLAATSEIVVDRPRGSAHPRFAHVVYPLDYGYLAATQAGDGCGIDVWLSAGSGRSVTAIACTADSYKRDVEIKILLGCTDDEVETIRSFLNNEGQGCIVLRRERD